ncbi:unnamed protein product [Haemonchus placei]|uniref:Piwi domain-containing protein n=1 Tax=Haemonchus placei TaxID=6290 RepID=A0A0N4W4H5_HAEPC|nr:unnamed protein product [Haemonchus placei]
MMTIPCLIAVVDDSTIYSNDDRLKAVSPVVPLTIVFLERVPYSPPAPTSLARAAQYIAIAQGALAATLIRFRQFAKTLTMP